MLSSCSVCGSKTEARAIKNGAICGRCLPRVQEAIADYETNNSKKDKKNIRQ